ncbi:LamG domain-containing protein [Parabacteroides faecis]|uniref:LamG domain-containing protein n=1 Tax=Parabacteroides faecis TaxID=1217282 RepID=UPI00216499E7|nr:LamG domain-containing protein [Parabacteroides faecis]MCS2889611.1 LamG domain-containing protein [Parabacteroides faecis]UVQ46679.1 LamG domain-containing protein [Parabacteroides faecis]
MKKVFFSLILMCACLFSVLSIQCKTDSVERVKKYDGLVALWDFSEKEESFVSTGGKDRFELTEYPGKIDRVEEGPLSGRSIYLDGSSYLSIPYGQTGALNVKTNAVTVVAWVKWAGEKTGFVAGMWNEYDDGGKRQYGLFVSLPCYNGANQVCGHISKTGGATPPFPYSLDYSSSKQVVPANKWSCVAFTYDGRYIRSYLNGRFEEREPELIDNTTGFEGYPDGLIQSKNPYEYPDGIGDNGSDFTVGAVSLHSGMGNFFKGQIGGIAVFDRALSDTEIKQISDETL